MADRIILRVKKFQSVVFWAWQKNCKLHKTRPGSFFAQINHFIKNKLQSFKAFPDPPQADQP
jgi:hypothetical protein